MISESYEREVLHLIEIEKEFINQIELGVQLYSRPLKHYLISSTEHAKLFQNIEKVRDHSKQSKSKCSFDLDLSNFALSIESFAIVIRKDDY